MDPRTLCNEHRRMALTAGERVHILRHPRRRADRLTWCRDLELIATLDHVRPHRSVQDDDETTGAAAITDQDSVGLGMRRRGRQQQDAQG